MRQMAVSHLPPELTIVARMPFRSLLDLPCFRHKGIIEVDVMLLISQGILSLKEDTICNYLADEAPTKRRCIDLSERTANTCYNRLGSASRYGLRVCEGTN